MTNADIALNSLVNRISGGIAKAGSVIIIKTFDNGMPYATGPFTDEGEAFDACTTSDGIDETLTVQAWFINGKA